ncbi:hypothetical protein NLG97_g7120 [Lecanicillium saksenae]|uniref:Uncharacterized protein n=1 Tax=Lecanicillium saksenae TaxID=468837 RepID=A0ACC1QMQ6_9HYPO|nr:hypothetical protein NLG97_g7120 [Lecanicillium saksenae]
MVLSISAALARNNGQLRLCETHDRASTELVRDIVTEQGDSFDGVWISGLTQTTVLGVPDTELVSPLQRALLMPPVDKPLAHNSRQLCGAFDADSGGAMEDIPTLVNVLNMNGISMIIIEDKVTSAPGQKVNSLLATSGSQGQADMHEFAKILGAFKTASAGKDILVTARIESFTTRVSLDDPEKERASKAASQADALARAQTYTEGGADAIMIHSKSKDPTEVIEFLRKFRESDAKTPLVVVPTTYSSTARSVLADAGANVFIYANHLMRARISAAAQAFMEAIKALPEGTVKDGELVLFEKTGNYGCLLRMLAERRYLAESESKDISASIMACGLQAEKKSLENMSAAIRELIEGQLCGNEADSRIITVKELLAINASQIAVI